MSLADKPPPLGYTQQQVDYVRQEYPYTPTKVMAVVMGMPPLEVRRLANKLCIKRARKTADNPRPEPIRQEHVSRVELLVDGVCVVKAPLPENFSNRDLYEAESITKAAIEADTQYEIYLIIASKANTQ